MTTILSPNPPDVHRRFDSNGHLLASAFKGRDGWQVTNQRYVSGGVKWHQICVSSERDALAVLDAVASALNPGGAW